MANPYTAPSVESVSVEAGSTRKSAHPAIPILFFVAAIVLLALAWNSSLGDSGPRNFKIVGDYL